MAVGIHHLLGPIPGITEHYSLAWICPVPRKLTSTGQLPLDLHYLKIWAPAEHMGYRAFAVRLKEAVVVVSPWDELG